MRNDNTNQDRPRTLKDFHGQPEETQAIKIMIDAAKTRGGMPGHILLSGPAGLGKTTLARIVATEMGAHLISLLGQSIDEIKAFNHLLQTSSKNQEKVVLFIDEIHALKTEIVEGVLYTLMEDNTLNVDIGGTIYPAPFKPDLCVIGATTRQGKLPKPLLDRFTHKAKLELYDVDTITSIVNAATQRRDMDVTRQAEHLIAHCSRQTPRIALSIVDNLQDYMQAKTIETLDVEDTIDGLATFGMDRNGVTRTEKKYMEILATKTRPTGVKPIAVQLNEEPTTIEETIEPHLIGLGYVERTPSGRILTEAGQKYIADK